MNTNKLLALPLLAALLPQAAFGEPSSWEQAYAAAGAGAARIGGAAESLPSMAPLGAPVNRNVITTKGLGIITCVELGRHSDKIPDFDPIHRACVTDALAGPGEYDRSVNALVAKIRAGGGRLMPVASDPFSGIKDEFQQGLGKGNIDKAALDETGHWGDVIYVQLKPVRGDMVPVAIYAVTYRAYRITDRDGSYLMARRVDFTANGQGRLNSVQFYTGVKLAGAPSMAWLQGPSGMLSDTQSLEGLWGRRWRQLLESWLQ